MIYQTISPPPRAPPPRSRFDAIMLRPLQHAHMLPLRKFLSWHAKLCSHSLSLSLSPSSLSLSLSLSLSRSIYLFLSLPTSLRLFPRIPSRAQAVIPKTQASIWVTYTAQGIPAQPKTAELNACRLLRIGISGTVDVGQTRDAHCAWQLHTNTHTHRQHIHLYSGIIRLWYRLDCTATRRKWSGQSFCASCASFSVR